MSILEIGIWSFPVLLIMIFLRIPIGLSMLIAGFVGSYLVTGSWLPIMSKMKNETYSTFSSYSLSIVPLFLLMGQFATLGGMSQALFKAAETWMGHKKGGVAMAAIGACAGFGSICGSSLATTPIWILWKAGHWYVGGWRNTRNSHPSVVCPCYLCHPD